MLEIEYGLSLYSKIAFMMAFMNISLALIIYLGSKKLSSRYFALLALTYALWIINHGFMHGVGKSYELQHFFLNNSNYLGIFPVTMAAIFSLTFPEEKKPSRVILVILSSYFLFMIPAYYFAGNFMINVTDPIAYEPYWNWEYGRGGILFFVPYFLLWLFAIYNMYMKAKRSAGKTRKNLYFIFWGFIVAGIVPSIVSVILPHLTGNQDFAWFSSAFSSAWVLVIGYSILKYNQMNIKTVFTELLVLAAVGLLFLSIFI
ncbi:MAG: hypothetical protein KAS07_00640 [Candidatus Pacebacteria bacterium]|nr:hypothetical protein [Candidatus Paceibacterota bacterium]